ncbi:unnamed protein product [Miscanthus lutarioriparius]|uniref:Elongator complex protein 6 n=1 Tax=Miscanthus lutarioriparius TaxID=422564 RepID=A0A811SK36_9POAL|nr:unnamed protein product [Miscanthus lutarioriparius]
MEEYGGGGGDLLSEAMGSAARVVVVEDCVEAPGAFVLHLLLKRALASGGAAAFLALAQPFSYYDRVLRKMGCNLSLHRRNERLHFFELLGFPGKASFYYRNCSLVVLIHEDIYADEENMGLLLHLRYIADLVIKAAPLSTGLAADVHGQLSVVNKGTFSEQRAKAQKVWNFHFKGKENGADFFYPGTRH